MPPVPGSRLETWCSLHPHCDFIFFVRLLYVHICVKCVDDRGFIPTRYLTCLTRGRNSHEPIVEGLNIYVYLSIYLYIIRCWFVSRRTTDPGCCYRTVACDCHPGHMNWPTLLGVLALGIGIPCIIFMLFSASWWSLYRDTDVQMYTW